MIKAYKLVRVRKDGTIGSLFANRRQRHPVGVWLEAKPHRTSGLAFRPGWHCTYKPEAPHLKMMDDRQWWEVDVDGVVELQRPAHQGGAWVLAERMRLVRRLEVGK